MAYAVIGFGAVCLWLLTSGSPAAADEGPSGLLGSVTSPVTKPTATDPVGRFADRAFRQVADVERRTTDTVREVAAHTPVETASPIVERVTGTLDAVTTRALDTGDRAVDQLAPGEPTTGPDPEDPLETGLASPVAVLRADPAVRPTAPRELAAHRVGVVPGTAVESVRQPPASLAAGPLAAAGPFLDTTPAAADGAPDASTAGAGAQLVTSVVPTTTVRLPQTSSAPVVPEQRTAAQQPVFSPGFAPD
jgi:hypothetical protein